MPENRKENVEQQDITALFPEILDSMRHKATTEEYYFYARKNLPPDHTKNMGKLSEDRILTAWFSIIKPKIRDHVFQFHKYPHL
jgi:hypothetical protein